MNTALKEKIGISSAVAAFFAFTLLGFGPSYIYFTNRTQFNCTYPEVVTYLLPLFWACTGILVTVFSPLKELFFKKSLSVLFAVSLLFFLQGNVAVLKINPFTGRHVDWSAYWVRGVVELCIWIFVIGAFWIKTSSVYKHLQHLSIYLVLFQLLLLLIMFGFSDLATITAIFQPVPTAPTLLSPQGHITTNNPHYTWTESTEAKWYYLTVEGSLGWVMREQPYKASEVCSKGMCSVTPSTALTDGKYSWSVRASRSDSKNSGASSKGGFFSIGDISPNTNVFDYKSAFENFSKNKKIATNFSKHKNVVMLVLDGFRSDIFREILQEDNTIKNSFSEFIYFYNTTAAYPSTTLSIPNVLTGQYYKNDVPIFQFIEESFTECSVPKVLKMNAFQVDLFPAEPEVVYCDESTATYCTSVITFDASHYHQMVTLLNVTFFRYVPTLAKRHFAKAGAQFYHQASLNVMQYFMNNATANSVNPVFKYIHFTLPHAPLQMNENLEYEPMEENLQSVKKQSRAALKIAIKMISLLKKLEVFEQSLIFVISDHGFHPKMPFNRKLFGSDETASSATFDPSRLIPKAGALLLVKPFSTSASASSGEIKMSGAPVTLGDIPATIARELGIESNFPGRSIFTISESESRVRQFFNHGEWGLWHTWDFFPHLEQFYIIGNVWEQNSWKASGDFDVVLPIESYQQYKVFKVENRERKRESYVAVQMALGELDLAQEKLGDREFPPHVFRSESWPKMLEKLKHLEGKVSYRIIFTSNAVIALSEELNTAQHPDKDMFSREFAPLLREFELPPYLLKGESIEQLRKKINSLTTPVE